MEWSIYQHLISDPDVVQNGIPHLIHYGDFGDYKVMVLTKTGPTLYTIRHQLEEYKLKFESILKIGMQAVCAIRAKSAFFFQ